MVMVAVVVGWGGCGSPGGSYPAQMCKSAQQP